jgi:hypothetical protein
MGKVFGGLAAFAAFVASVVGILQSTGRSRCAATGVGAKSDSGTTPNRSATKASPTNGYAVATGDFHSRSDQFDRSRRQQPPRHNARICPDCPIRD